MELMKSIGAALAIALYLFFAAFVWAMVVMIALLMCASPFILAYFVIALILENFVAALVLAVVAAACLILAGKLSISISINKGE